MIVLFVTFAATTLILNFSQHTFQRIQSGGQMWVEDEISVCILLSEGSSMEEIVGFLLAFLLPTAEWDSPKKEQDRRPNTRHNKIMTVQ